MRGRIQFNVSLNTDPPRSQERLRRSWQRSGHWEPDLWGFLTRVPRLYMEATVEDRDRRIEELEAEVERQKQIVKGWASKDRA